MLLLLACFRDIKPVDTLPTPLQLFRAWEDQCKTEGGEACAWALVLARELGVGDPLMEQALMEKSCDAGFSWPCLQLGVRAAPEDLERAKDAWRRACEAAPNDYHCGLVDGRWDWKGAEVSLAPQVQENLASAGAVFTMPPAFALSDKPFLELGYTQEQQTLTIQYAFGTADSLSFALNAHIASGGGKLLGTPENLPPLISRLEFGADEAMVGVVGTALAPGGLALALRKDKEVIIEVALFTDLSLMRGAWPAALHAVQFVPQSTHPEPVPH